MGAHVAHQYLPTHSEIEEMTKEQILETLKLLSALEAWTFTERHSMPTFLIERMDRVVEVLTKEVLK